MHIGFDMEWEFTTAEFSSSSKRTALIQIALPNAVYLFRVHLLKQLPSPFKTILTTEKVVKIG